VTLAPAAEPGSRFLGWDGACNTLGTCQVIMPTTATPGPSLFAVFGANRPPTARAGGPYGGVRQSAIAFNGSASTDPDGDVLTYEWAFGDGATATGVTPTHAYAALGTFAVTLTVRDGFGGSSSSSTTATISNRPPVARPGGPYAAVHGQPITFIGSASTDPDGDALTYEWTFGDGATATGIAPTHAYAALGTFTVILTVRDGLGASSSSSTIATISNESPLARPGGPYGAVHGQTITFVGSASTDPDGDALTYEWTFGDGATATGASPTHAYGVPGSYTVDLTVRDAFGGVGSASTTATIGNRAPTANPGGQYTGVRRRSVTFNGALSTDPDGDLLTYEWTFGDGGTATGTSPAHTYQSAGTYTVSLRVRDAFGAAATATTTATITQN
jgi:PKD repeat protein